MQDPGAERILPRAAVVVAASCGVLFLLLALSASTGEFSNLDYQLRALAEHARRPFWDLAMRDVSLMGDRSGLLPLIVLAVALLWRPSRRWAIAVPVVMAGTGAVQFVAKWAVDRPRPNHTAWGFPSGHVLSLVVLFGLLSYVLCQSNLRRHWQHLGSGLCAGIVLTVAWSRVYLEAHWLSDIAGGLMLGLACLLLSIWLVDVVIVGHALRPRGEAGPALQAVGVMPMTGLLASGSPAAVDESHPAVPTTARVG